MGITRARYCVIDISGVYRRHFHATEHLEQNEAYSRTISDVAQSTHGYRNQDVIICCDSPGKTFRHELTEAYKSHRAEPPPGLYDLLRATERELAKSYHVLRAPGFEADDVCATVAAFLCDAHRADGERRFELEVDLVSTDKDLGQCVTDQVTWVSPIKGDRYDKAGVREKFGCEPWQLPHLQALMGDSSDGYPGVRGIGPKMAAKVIAAFNSIPELITAVGSRDLNGPRYMAVRDVLKEKKTFALIDAIADGSLAEGLELAKLRRDALQTEDLDGILGDGLVSMVSADVPKAESEPPMADEIAQVFATAPLTATQPQATHAGDDFAELFNI